MNALLSWVFIVMLAALLLALPSYFLFLAFTTASKKAVTEKENATKDNRTKA
jgi:hypothetical protein